MKIDKKSIQEKLEIAKAKELAYWEGQLIRCALGKPTEVSCENVMTVLKDKFGWI
jgi:hypothetical protein